MRILQAHKFFYHRGGAETVFFQTIDALRARGHEVAEFSMQKKDNMPSDYSAYFAPELPELSQQQDFFTSAKIFFHLFKSREIERKLSALILAADPQVAHLHNIYHHLSATTFRTLKKHRVPMVMTVHDVQPMCPNHRMIRGTDNTLCERCFRHNYYNCAVYKCVNKSRLASAAAALESYYYQWKKIWDLIDIFICPSQFMMDKLAEWGFPRKRMRLVPNPYVVPETYPPLGNKIVYLGRFHQEKGIKVLLASLPYLRDYQAVIAGDGPERKWVETTLRQCSLGNVEKIGWVHAEAWRRLMAEARVIVVPSVFYENCSMTILEAMANGRLVVAADRGGNGELIINGQTGFLVKPEDPVALTAGIREAMNLAPLEAELMIKNARELVHKNHSIADYLRKLEMIYDEVKR